MNFRQFIINRAIQFFMLTTLISAAICVLGLIYDNEARFGYDAFLSPLIFAAACTAPTLVTYSKRELTAKELLPRMVLEFLLIEAVVIAIAYFSPRINTTKPSVVISLAISVFIIYILICFFEWIKETVEAKQMNQYLQIIQKLNEK